MEKRPINPWQWQENFGFSQAVEISGGQQMLFCAGQTSMSADGEPLHKDDMLAQINLALDNLEEVLRNGGCSLQDVVRLNFYTTDVDRLLASYGDVVNNRLAALRTKPAMTLLGVTRLAFPELLVEIEATAVR